MFFFYVKRKKRRPLLFHQNNKFIYQYGKDLAKPELHLVRSEKEVSTEPAQQVGKVYWGPRITLKNNNYSYTLQTNMATSDEGYVGTEKLYGEVNIYKNDSLVATVSCSQLLINNLDAGMRSD